MDGEDDDFLLLWLLFDLNFGDNANNDLMVVDKKWTIVPVDVERFRTMGHPSFPLHFRLNRATFEGLLEVIANYIEGKNLFQRGRMPELDLMLMKAIWILATPDSFRSVALTFGTYPSTVHRHYSRIIATLCDLAPRFIKWPDAAERQYIANAFSTYSGFPGIVGCIDGTLVTVTAPLIQAKRYVDRHHQYSINVQVVCDHQLLVRDIHVGEAGSMHDGRVFRRSPLSKTLLTNADSLEPNQHLIGDNAYALTDKLLTPFRNNGQLTDAQKRYNYLLCKCRARIEHCFGKLFSQWRRIKFLHSYDFEYAVETIVASVVLHNFMILNGQDVYEVVDEDEDEDNIVPDDPVYEHMLEGECDILPDEFVMRHPLVQLTRQAQRDGVLKRQQLMEYLQE